MYANEFQTSQCLRCHSRYHSTTDDPQNNITADFLLLYNNKAILVSEHALRAILEWNLGRGSLSFLTAS